MWTCFRCFPYCLQPRLFAAESVDAMNGGTKSAKSVYTKDVFAKNGCARGAGIIKYLKIYLQSF